MHCIRRGAGVQGWLRFLGQISWRYKWICGVVDDLFRLYLRLSFLTPRSLTRSGRSSVDCDAATLIMPRACTLRRRVNIVRGLVVQRLVGAGVVKSKYSVSPRRSCVPFS